MSMFKPITRAGHERMYAALSFDFMRKSFEYSSSVIGNSSRISLIALCRFCSIVREIAGCVGFILSSLSRVETSCVSINSCYVDKLCRTFSFKRTLIYRKLKTFLMKKIYSFLLTISANTLLHTLQIIL